MHYTGTGSSVVTAIKQTAKKENNAKYSPVNVKGSRVEFRLPSAVKKQNNSSLGMI